MAIATAGASSTHKQPRTLAFVGCLNREAPYFQGARGRGIAVFDLDPGTGHLTLLSERTGIDNPTFLTVDARGRTLYASSEVFGWNEGLVTAFRVNPAAGVLGYVNMQPTLGSIAAHCTLDPGRRHLLVANYTMTTAGDPAGHSVAVFPVRADGGIGPSCGAVAHSGSGPVQNRQEGPHPHCVLPSPDGRFVLVSDLGIDRILTYRLDGALGRLDEATRVALPEGSGPRHLAFHPGGRLVYAINELSSTIAVFAYGPENGRLELLQLVPALPSGYAETSHCADLHVAADGRFLYGSNRGHDSIVTYAIDGRSGRMTLVGHTPSGGRTPRSFALDASGRFLLAANQNSDSVAVFHIDPDTGQPGESCEQAAIGTPVCIKLAQFEWAEGRDGG